MQNRGSLIRNRGFLTAFLLTFFVIYALYFIPIPYYIYKPGSAEALKPMVQVEGGDAEEHGVFMLTTVSVGRSSIFEYLLARLNPHAEIREKEEILRGSTEEEYSTRQQYVMLDSQSNAIQAAYKAAGIPYRIASSGVMIMQTMEGFSAHGVLHPGDKIVSIDSVPVSSHSEIRSQLDGKQAGETVQVAVQRGKTEKTYKIELKDLNAVNRQPAEGGAAPGGDGSGSGASGGTTAESRPGLGITLVELLEIQPEQEEKRVKIDAKEIGGPSAGLMFSLEILNQLTPGDLTKGYRIAGTGTIDPEGNVCSIGGIRHKIVAADREKADIFFAPADRKKGECNLAADVPNATDAIDQAAKIGTKMKVVPVATLEEALRYLDGLPPKEQA